MSRIKKPYTQIYRTLCTSTTKPQRTNLEKAGPMSTLLKSRSVIRFSGPDTVKFLQGLLTNDVKKFGEDPIDKSSSLPTPNMGVVTSRPMYAALLTPQGRFLYDLFLYRSVKEADRLDSSGEGPGSENGGKFELFADVDRAVSDEVLQTFKKYRLRSKVEIDNVAENFSCWQRFGEKLCSSEEEPEANSVGWGGGLERAGTSAARGSKHGWQWYKDPRLSCLGFRGIFPSDITPPLVEADQETDELNYLMWRLEKGVAEGSTEIPKGEAVPLEYNFVGLNAISFDKGCYVGQELIARTHHRGVIRKRLLPLRFVDDNGKEMNQKVAAVSEVIDSKSGKKAGTVTTALGCRGLGVLRLDDAFKGSAALAIQGQEDVKVEAIKPEWWPAEWTEGHQNSAVS